MSEQKKPEWYTEGRFILSDDGMIAACEGSPDEEIRIAAHIVKCVNCHDDLLEALNEAVVDLVILRNYIVAEVKNNQKWEGVPETIDGRIDVCRAALLKATGENHD